MTTASGGSGAVRSHLIEALEADLVGPFRAGSATELLRIAPSRWYLTGFLVPREQGEIDEPDDGDGDEGAGDDVDEEDGQKPDPTVKKVRRLPASMGLSVLLNASVKQLEVSVSWADYVRNENKHWSRSFQKRSVSLPIVDAKLREGVEISQSGGLRLEGRVEKTSDGVLAVAVFIVNNRAEVDGASRDEAYAFQVQLALECPAGFVGRFDHSDEHSEDTDDNVNDLLFRNTPRVTSRESSGKRAISPGFQRTPAGSRKRFLIVETNCPGSYGHSSLGLG